MTVRYPLARDGVFWTLQGEGLLRGVPMCFVRLAGCSMGCPECDTDYRVHQRLSIAEILTAVLAVTPAHPEPWVWITGGEPTDYDLEPLVSALHGIGRRVALATSGVRRVTGPVAFLSVSPHQADFVQTYGDELKVVPGLNGLPLEAIQARNDLAFGAKFMQPLWGNASSVRDCAAWVLAHPDWRLTDQGHKAWGLP